MHQEVLHCTVDYPKHDDSWTRITMNLYQGRSLLSPLIDPMMHESDRHLSQNQQDDDKSNDLMSGVEAFRL